MTNVEVFLHNNPDVTAVVTYHICYSCTTQIEHLDDKVCCPFHLYIAILPAHFEPNYYSVSSCFCYSLETRLFIPYLSRSFVLQSYKTKSGTESLGSRLH